MRSRYEGQEIAAGAVVPLVEVMHAAKINPHLLPDLHALRQPKVRISWDQFLAILNLARQHYTDEQLMAIGASALSSSYYHSRITFARHLLTIEDGYRLMVYPHNTIDYGCIQAAVQAEPGHVRITAMLFDEYQPSETFFVLLQGATQELPRLFGVQGADFCCTRNGRHMHFDIKVPTTDQWRSRLKRQLSSRIRQLYCTWNKSNADDELVRRTFALETALRERDKAQEALRQDRADQQRRMEHVSDVIVEYDHLNQVVYLSPNGEKVFGYPNNVLLDSPLKILQPEDVKHAEAFFANPKTIPSGSYPMRGMHANGHPIDLEVAVHHFDDNLGRPRWVATFRDLSEHKLSTFKPAQSATSQPNAAQHQSAAVSQAESPTLLIADDDEMTRRVAHKILVSAGYKVVCVGYGNSALLEMGHHDLDALVLDINMPGLSGIEVYERLQSTDVDIPILFMSGNPEQVAEKYPRLAVVAKPFRSVQLIEAVRGVVAA